MIWNKRKEKTFNQNSKKKKEPPPKKKDSASSFWENFKHINIEIIRMQEREKKEQENQNLFEKKLKENLPNMGKEIDIQVQEEQRTPIKMDTNRSTPRHMIFKRPKLKDKES